MRASFRLLVTTALSLVLTVSAPFAGESEDAMTASPALPSSLVLETVEGEPFDLGSLRGERTLIVTWASW